MTPHNRLPPGATRTFNRCNVPAEILASLDFQAHPLPLQLDGVAELHRELFDNLIDETDPLHRAQHFIRYMRVTFQLEHPEAVGHLQQDTRPHRTKADYLRVLRGWGMSSDGREGAVLKGWVESRFGLVPRYHNGPLSRDDLFRSYQADWAAGLIGTNALEAQFDLVYAYCQQELHRRDVVFTTLYRGVNRLEDFEILEQHDPQRAVVLLNNLNSFSLNRERAGEFGDYILSVRVPRQKILYHSDLIPGPLRGEEEMMVIGGAYAVSISLT